MNFEQYSNNCNPYMTFYDYLKTINGKTASLFHISAYGGALIGGSSEKETRYLARFGSYLGMNFFLGLIQAIAEPYKFKESEALKPIKSDIVAGVINLPLLMSFLKEPTLRSNAKYIMSTKSDVDSLIKDVYRLNGVESSSAIAQKYGTKAKAVLYNINNTTKSDTLLKLLNEQLIVIDKF